MVRIFLTFCLFLLVQTFFAQSVEQQMLNLVNELRQNNGLDPVYLNISLNDAARIHSEDMATNNYFSHTGQNGSNFSQRAISAGYEGSPRGENIAAGNSTVQATFNQWVNSTGHLNNMLNAQANEMGIGYGYDNGSTYKHYWTQIFGRGDITLSNDDIADVENIKLYPNPTKNKFTVKFKNITESALNFRIVSVTGQVVVRKTTNLIDNKLVVDIENLTEGVYFFYVNNRSKGYKIIKT